MKKYDTKREDSQRKGTELEQPERSDRNWTAKEEHLEFLKKELRKCLEEHIYQDDEQILALIDELILQEGKKRISLAEKDRLQKELFYSVRRLDILQELLDDDTITEIMVNGPDHIFLERNGKMERWDGKFSTAEKLEDVIQQIVGRCNRVVNESMPIVDARLSNGDRVNVVVHPVALNGPILTIRRFPDKPIDMERLIRLGTLTDESAEFLKHLVENRYTIIIGGGTATGKTTFLNALSAYIPAEERIITIEDNAELKLQGIPNLVRLEAKSANMEGGVSVTIRDLIRSALRMRPDRIIVGEVRGAEAIEMLFSAVNTGHRGSMCSAHANSCYDMLSRLETMVLMGMDIPLSAIQRQIASGIDVLIHLGRNEKGERKVVEIMEVQGYENGQIVLNPLYVWQSGKGLTRVGDLKNRSEREKYV